MARLRRTFGSNCAGCCEATQKFARRSCAVAFALLVGCLLVSAPSTAHVDRVERRARELALPDPLLDPSWPELDPLRSDSAPTADDVEEESGVDEREGVDESRSVDGKVQPPGDEDEPEDPLETVPHPDGSDGFEPDPFEW